MTKVKTIKLIRRFRIIWVMPDGSLEAECRTWPSMELAEAMAEEYRVKGMGPSLFHMVKEDETYE